MINDGQVYLAGYVASPPAFHINAGTPKATVRVAFTPRWLSRETGEWADGPTSFVNVLCWRGLAGNVAVSLRKGEPVLVMGRLRIRRYQDREGAPRTAVEVEAHSIGHDLTRGVAAFSRTRRAPGETAVEAADALTAAGAGADGERGDAGEQAERGERGDTAAHGGRAELGDPADPEGAEPGPGGGFASDEEFAAPDQALDGELDDAAVARFQELGESLSGAAAPL